LDGTRQLLRRKPGSKDKMKKLLETTSLCSKAVYGWLKNATQVLDRSIDSVKTCAVEREENRPATNKRIHPRWINPFVYRDSLPPSGRMPDDPVGPQKFAFLIKQVPPTGLMNKHTAP
jgi:hypothetical protein